MIPFPSMADEYETTHDLAWRIYDGYGYGHGGGRHGNPDTFVGEILEAAYDSEPAIIAKVFFTPGGESLVKYFLRQILLF